MKIVYTETYTSKLYCIPVCGMYNSTIHETPNLIYSMNCTGNLYKYQEYFQYTEVQKYS